MRQNQNFSRLYACINLICSVNSMQFRFQRDHSTLPMAIKGHHVTLNDNHHIPSHSMILPAPHLRSVSTILEYVVVSSENISILFLFYFFYTFFVQGRCQPTQSQLIQIYSVDWRDDYDTQH